MIKYLKIKKNLVHQTAIINWKRVSIGTGNIIGPYVVIGNHPQHPKKKANGNIIIGNNNNFNEFCNIHLPTNLTKKTVIGNNNYFMNSTTIDHDCFVENDVVLSSNVILGGNIHIMNGAQLGIRTIVHQNQIIGSYSMLGINSMITKKSIIEPGYIFYGRPVKRIKKNLIGLKRNKIKTDSLIKEKKRFKLLFKMKKK